MRKAQASKGRQIDQYRIEDYLGNFFVLAFSFHLFPSLVCVFLFASELDDGNNQNQKEQNHGYCACITQIPVSECFFINVVNKYNGRFIDNAVGAACQHIYNVVYLKAVDGQNNGYEEGSRLKLRPGNIAELLPWACAVQAGCLVKLCIDTLKTCQINYLCNIPCFSKQRTGQW